MFGIIYNTLYSLVFSENTEQTQQQQDTDYNDSMIDIFIAAENGDLKKVQEFLSEIHHADYVKEGKTPLEFAFKNYRQDSNKKVIALLSKNTHLRNKNTSSRNKSGFSSIFVAQYNDTHLHIAVRIKDLDAIVSVIKHGDGMYEKNFGGQTPKSMIDKWSKEEKNNLFYKLHAAFIRDDTPEFDKGYLGFAINTLFENRIASKDIPSREIKTGKLPQIASTSGYSR